MEGSGEWAVGQWAVVAAKPCCQFHNRQVAAPACYNKLLVYPGAQQWTRARSASEGLSCVCPRLLLTAYSLLPTAYCLLPTPYCLLPTAFRPTAFGPAALHFFQSFL